MNSWFRRSPLLLSGMGGDAKYSRKSSSSTTTLPGGSITMGIIIILVLFGLLWTRDYSHDQYGLGLSTLPDSSTYSLAKQESLGFFDDISQSEWQLLKQKVAAIYPNTYGHMRYSELKQSTNRNFQPNHFYQNQFEPDFACQHEQ